MDKAQALHQFWSSFGIPAIDENSAYDTQVLEQLGIGYPCITYEVAESNLVSDAGIAAEQGVTGLYTVTTGKQINLQYHDVFRRVSDGKIFRCTSDGDDKKTPASASLNMRQVQAEEWELTSNG